MEDYEKKTEVIKFRATRAQRYEITRRALDYGFSSVSAFVLWAVLEEDHTEKGAAALTASLEKLHSEAGETLSRIQSDLDARQEDFSAAVSSATDEAAARLEKWGEVNARKIEEVLERFEEEQKAAARREASKKKDKEKFMEELLPMAGIAAAVVLAYYIFRHFLR